MNKLQRVQAAQEALLHHLSDQVAVGISRTSDGKYCLAVRIQMALPEGVIVPDEFQGFPVDTQYIGSVRPLGG